MNLWSVSISATIPPDVIAQEFVSLVVLECSLERMLNPSEILVSAAITQKSLPAIAITWLTEALTNCSSFITNIWVELTLVSDRSGLGHRCVSCEVLIVDNWSLLKGLLENVDVGIVLLNHISDY